jgi:hypothetical protein
MARSSHLLLFFWILCLVGAASAETPPGASIPGSWLVRWECQPNSEPIAVLAMNREEAK